MKKGKYQNRQSYLDAGLELIGHTGIDKLTMRKLANHMGVSAMAVYKHFDSKDQLLEALLDEFIARAGVLPEKEMQWDEWTGEVARGMYDALSHYPSWLPLLGRISLGPAAMQVTTAFVQKHIDAGFDFPEAVESYLAMIQLVVGAVTIESSIRENNPELQANIRAISENLPLTGEGNQLPVGRLLNDRQLEPGLELLLEALRSRLVVKQKGNLQ